MDSIIQPYPNYTNIQYNNYQTYDDDDDLINFHLPCGDDHESPTSHDLSPSSDGSDPPEETDYFDGVLKYMNQMLMEEEEDLQNKPCMYQECSALQAAEKSFYDLIAQEYPPSPDHRCHYYQDQESRKDKKTRVREDSDEQKSNKQLATYNEDEEEHDDDDLCLYDQVLLCEALNPGLHDECPFEQATIEEKKYQLNPQPEKPRARSKRNKNPKGFIDLRSLLTQCAQAISNSDLHTAYELLNQIRENSSAYGDGTERLAHHFANAIEARLAGTGTMLYSASATQRVTAKDGLKAYQAYIKACPFRKMSNIFANKSIGRFARKATELHIIDFGILYGFQWPCLIQGLSLRPGGPPKLRITGIDFPQPGSRPTERVEDTGRRLANYCKRFNVPFEYNAIAKKWEDITLEDLKIDKDQKRNGILIVNSLYRLKNVLDETLSANDSPRDAVLDLIKRVDPDLFIHGVVNGNYNAPFFVTRFREALFHFSTLFDMFEATAERESAERSLYERGVIGREVMNVIACEGSARIERPETYRQWGARNVRAGFRQVGLYSNIVSEVSRKVKARYHGDFLVDEDSNWMLHGWKGRVLYALSCWKPIKD